MCLALIAIDQHPLYPLIIVSNRDEFYSRQSAPADFWDEDPHVFSGRDLVKFGTWLGVNKNGHFALVTNFRNPKLYQSSMESRGLLVKNYLLECDNLSPLKYINKVDINASHYNQFNLIFGNFNDVYYYSNVQRKAQKLEAGLYGISNHLLDTPWYKVKRTKELFNQIRKDLLICKSRKQVTDLLFTILSDKILAPDQALPDTGMPKNLEKLLSSIFVYSQEYSYGTYSSSVILFERNNILFSEKIFMDGVMRSINTTNIKPLHFLF